MEFKKGDYVRITEDVRTPWGESRRLFAGRVESTPCSKDGLLLIRLLCGEEYSLLPKSVEKITCEENMNRNVSEFAELATKITELYEKKNEAYGDSFAISVSKYGSIAALTRISDKFNRFESLVLGAKNNVHDESIYDTLMDLASYSLMTYMALKGGVK